MNQLVECTLWGIKGAAHQFDVLKYSGGQCLYAPEASPYG